MDAALREAIDRHLRPVGFTGSIPHLRRRLDEQVDLISIQHFSSGGSFVVEVACVPPKRIILGGRSLEPASIRAIDVSNPRPRIGADNFPQRGDHWFHYAPRNYEVESDRLFHSPDTIAEQVIQLLREQAEPWWRVQPFPS